MKKTICVDNGHGKDTPGKRTPKMPNGQVIHEWQFNYPTAKKLGRLLEHNGFKVIYASDTSIDTSLKSRVDKANNANADMFVSVHYNAFQGKFGNHGGIETFYYPSSNKGKKVATLVQNELIKETGLRNRGAKAGNLYVLRKTKMTSILCECGFMDNLNEAKLMLNESYQWKCARAITKGICKYYGVTFKDLSKQPPKKTSSNNLYRVQVGAFSNKANAEKLQKELKSKGYSTIIKGGK